VALIESSLTQYQHLALEITVSVYCIQPCSFWSRDPVLLGPSECCSQVIFKRVLHASVMDPNSHLAISACNLLPCGNRFLKNHCVFLHAPVHRPPFRPFTSSVKGSIDLITFLSTWSGTLISELMISEIWIRNGPTSGFPHVPPTHPR
jgi:hypothetical protein